MFDISASLADEQVGFSNVDTSGVGTQSSSVEFRLYGDDYTSSTDFSGLGNHPGPTPLTGSGSDLSIGGQVLNSLPEPATGVLVCLGLAGMAWERRIRRS